MWSRIIRRCRRLRYGGVGRVELRFSVCVGRSRDTLRGAFGPFLDFARNERVGGGTSANVESVEALARFRGGGDGDAAARRRPRDTGATGARPGRDRGATGARRPRHTGATVARRACDTNATERRRPRGTGATGARRPRGAGATGARRPRGTGATGARRGDLIEGEKPGHATVIPRERRCRTAATSQWSPFPSRRDPWRFPSSCRTRSGIHRAARTSSRCVRGDMDPGSSPG